jgi:hypothetical protein
MGNKERVGHWILNNVHSLNLKIERMEWVQDWFPKYNDFKITLPDNLLSGRGVDADEDSALLKAFAELVERSVCLDYQIHSNGVAVHHDLSLAIENARKELIERDAILCHHLTGKPYFIDQKPRRFAELKSLLFDLGLDLAFAEAISAVEGIRVVLCRISGREKFGSFWGFGSETELDKAFEHAFFESMVNVSSFLYGRYKPTLNSQNLLNGLDHQNFHFMNKPNEMGVISGCNVLAPILALTDIKVQELKIENTLLSSVPMFAVRAESSRLQNIFYGVADETKINKERLRLFLDEDLRDISKVPHPIG